MKAPCEAQITSLELSAPDPWMYIIMKKIYKRVQSFFVLN